MPTLLLRFDDIARDEGPEIERVLRSMPGVHGAVVSIPEGCAEVDIADDRIGVDAIVERLKEEGYEVRVTG